MTRRVASQTLSPLRRLRRAAVIALGLACLAAGAQAQVRTHGEFSGSFASRASSWRDASFRTVVRQQYDYSCGSAAVATLLRFHYGLRVGEREIFDAMYERGDQARIRVAGFSMLDMRAYLERRGFEAEGLRLSFDRLAEMGVPAIALITHDNGGHFVVVKGISGDRVLVGDPMVGLLSYTREDFTDIWNGVVLVIRRPPTGWPSPAYNRAEEWRPWVTMPLDAAREPGPN